MARIPSDASLQSIQAAFRDLWAQVDKLLKPEINFAKGQKVTNAIDGTAPQDYATLSQLTSEINKLKKDNGLV